MYYYERDHKPVYEYLFNYDYKNKINYIRPAKTFGR